MTDPTAPGSFRMPRPSHGRVKDAMHPGLIRCPDMTPLRDVARILSTRHIHAVVVDRPAHDGTPAGWGVLTALDLVAAGGPFPEERTARDLLSTPPLTVSAEDPLERAVQLMAQHRVEHLVVLDAQDGHPAGLLSTLDVCGVLAWGEA